MWPNPQETADLVTFTEKILNGKLHFLRSDSTWLPQTYGKHISDKQIINIDEDFRRNGCTITDTFTIFFNFNKSFLQITISFAFANSQIAHSMSSIGTFGNISKFMAYQNCLILLIFFRHCQSEFKISFVFFRQHASISYTN